MRGELAAAAGALLRIEDGMSDTQRPWKIGSMYGTKFGDRWPASHMHTPRTWQAPSLGTVGQLHLSTRGTPACTARAAAWSSTRGSCAYSVHMQGTGSLWTRAVRAVRVRMVGLGMELAAAWRAAHRGAVKMICGVPKTALGERRAWSRLSSIRTVSTRGVIMRLCSTLRPSSVAYRTLSSPSSTRRRARMSTGSRVSLTIAPSSPITSSRSAVCHYSSTTRR